MQVTTYQPAQNLPAVMVETVIDTISIPNARTLDELFGAIREAAATTTDIARFLKKLGKHLTKSDLKVVEYALARAYYREHRRMTVRQVALVAHQRVDQILNHMRFLRIDLGSETMTNDQASRIMSRLMAD